MAIFCLSACSPVEEEKLPEMPTPPAAVEITALGQTPRYALSEVGTVVASKEVEVVAKASGIVNPLRVSVGDVVTESQNLGTVDVKADETAQINLDTAKRQLANAQQSYDETIANNQNVVTKAQLQINSIQTNIDQLERNLDELGMNNQSNLTSLELQIENAQKNVENSQINLDNLEAQFEQTWSAFFDNTELTLDTILINANSYYQTITDIINPKGHKLINQESYNPYLGLYNPSVANQTIVLYNQFGPLLEKSKADYELLLPLNKDSIDSAIEILSKLTDVSQELTQKMRSFLDNSFVASDLTETLLNSYSQSIDAAQTSALADLTQINQIKQNINATQLQQSTQLATAQNNLAITTNQLNEAKNTLNQFQSNKPGSVKDIENQLLQAKNNLAIAQADYESAKRSAELQKKAEELKIETFKNQVNLAETAFSENQIIASVGGTISELNIDAGDYVNVGTIVGKIIGQNEIKVIFYVTEKQVTQLTMGQKVTLYVPGTKNEIVQGTLVSIAPTADSTNRKIKIEVTTTGNFRPGMLIRLEADVTAKTFDSDKIYVELNSVIFGQNEQYVFVAEGNRAVQRNIETGDVIGKWVEVKEGLSLTDSLIVEGQRTLEDGDLIEISPVVHNDQTSSFQSPAASTNVSQ